MSTEFLYNIHFDVKYHKIQHELTQKYNLSINTPNQGDNIDEHYTDNDIEVICNKLYRDEFCSVFYSDNAFDDKIDIGIHTLREKMNTNQHFSNMMNEIKNTLLQHNQDTSEEEQDNDNDNDYIIFLSLFSYNTFYLMHKIICQFISNTPISNNLLDELKFLAINQLKQYET
jgi:hypothetical protein